MSIDQLQDHEEICRRCNGERYVKIIEGEYPCSFCGATGVVKKIYVNFGGLNHERPNPT